MRYCIKGGEIINPSGNFQGIGDLLIVDDQIAEIGKKLKADGAEIIDAQGKIVCPGLIDMHTHLREPGREDEETIASGTKAALKGGFTAVACMANTDPAIDNATIVSFVREQAQRNGYVKVYPIGAITKGLKGEELAEMGEMKAAGAVAFSDDGKTLMNPSVLRSALQYSKLFGVSLLLHEEDLQLAGNGVMNEGYWSTLLGLPGIPAVAEEIMIARDLLLAEETAALVHFCHVSTKGAVSLIREAKRRGVKVTAEATPHHFSLTDASLENYAPVYRVSPPLRTETDMLAVREGLKDGTIDVIATDHAPHSREEKHREFSLAPTGMIGLETALGLTWTNLVRTGYLSKIQLVEALSTKPAQILRQPGGVLKSGVPADVLVFDPEQAWEVTEAQLVSKSKNSPYLGQSLFGQVESVWINGILKYFNQSFIE